MPNWEDKWDDFSKKEIRESIEQDNNHEKAVQEVSAWVNDNEDAVVAAFKVSEGSDMYPRDTVTVFELDIDVEGHKLYFRVEESMDRDGGNEDAQTQEFSVDGQDCLHYGRFGHQSEAESWLEQELWDLATEAGQ